MDLKTLQEKFPVFTYKSFAWESEQDQLRFTFHFTAGKHEFHPTTQIHGVPKQLLGSFPKERMDTWAFQLGLAEMPSYWKAFCSPTIQIEAGGMNDEQITFWEKLFLKGMGEFFFVNNIEPFSPSFKSKGTQEEAKTPSSSSPLYPVDSILIPIGGGKDSIVTLEALANSGLAIIPFHGNLQASTQTVEVFSKTHKAESAITFTRTIDPHLIELNAQGHPNGHTPFSSMLAFLTSCVADIAGIMHIALSNEGSANEATVFWKGIDVNHQYSKSFEFEQDFRTYIQSVFENPPNYFSFLRPLYELQIIREFAKHKEYFAAFRSCNIGQKTNSWCGNCAKCAFVGLMLSAFLLDDEIDGIFGKPILDDESLSRFIDELIGFAPTKPFECVGTRTESQAALYLATQLRKERGGQLPKLLAHYQLWLTSHADQLEKTSQDVLHSFAKAHNVPEKLHSFVQELP